MNIDLTGRLALVTGGSGQLGRVMCRTLAACGADVAVHYHRNAAQAAALVAELRALGVRAHAVQADVTDEASVLAMQRDVHAALGDPDIIVNNAVIQYTWTTVLEQPLADFDSQYRSTVLHGVLMARAFVPAMITRGGGRVITINTECAMQTAPTQGAYAAGKRGLDGIMRVLAREIGPHSITVNQVAPGWMISEDHPADDSDAQAAYARGVPLRRRGTDQDVANLVTFLASDLAAFISGQFISVSGGNVMPTI
ncbi:3-oxoacyl-[acyl-carrier protein] reductase [Deinococcus metalli]|uniref:3-oxoacyl-[acyl-carrier protein] reductase n=1 Tax=Deinococcus metalli TaxID=1141878 RepID=A0A7W8NMM2_9DEIO|nr:SDR family oxidoreductase [Deinococcus metalli]MBB5375964.1 3-oxoacyl-[acyl-carrier protein] reductase [Deinococcus metalli]GHF35785.1 beta-ketoacyl-ACP reductase [Deinococcus metalli]